MSRLIDRNPERAVAVHLDDDGVLGPEEIYKEELLMRTMRIKWFGILGCLYLALGMNGAAWTEEMDHHHMVEPMPYRLLKEPSMHTAGKVKLEIFVDFYCPHCHRFEASVLPELRKEFGDKLEVTEVGFPVIRNKPVLPFELYEAARAEGKGAAMAHVLFRVLQDEKRDIENPDVQALVIKESDLNVDVVTKRLASGDPKRRLEEGISRGNRYGVHATPTVLLDGYVLSEVPTEETLRPLIGKLLSGESL